MKLDRLLEERWHLQPGATRNEVRCAETAMGATLPTDYVDLVTWSNGGDFRLGGRYLRLWSLQDVVLRNRRLEVHRHLPGTVAIGNDAGDMLYLLDYTSDANQPRLIEVEAGSMSLDQVVVHGSSLTAALYAWSGLENVRRSLLQCLSKRVRERQGNEP